MYFVTGEQGLVGIAHPESIKKPIAGKSGKATWCNIICPDLTGFITLETVNRWPA